jgi:3-hydroxyisobutyrate dehydrogenase-like beta-hydroxyacid dehydrogenase
VTPSGPDEPGVGAGTGGLAVALVGTGRMGSAMGARIRGAGLPLVVANRTREKAEALAARTGARVAGTPREAASGADVVVTSLTDDDAARATYLGLDGIVAGLRPGAVVADTSTIAPSTTRALAAAVADAGGTLIDTPVSGSVATVQAGTLLVMAGGDEAALEVARPALATFASRIEHLGPVGAGATMKLAVNALVHAINVALSEALVLAERAGVDREQAYDVIAAGAAGAPYVQYKRASFLDPEGTPVALALWLVAKDLALAADLAAAVGAPVAQLAKNRAIVDAAITAGFGDADLSSVAAYLRER